MADALKKRRHLEMQALAEPYTQLALKTLVNICRVGESDKDRLGAAKEILDRAYGKSIQGHLLQVVDEAEDQIEEVSDRAERFTSSIAGLAARGRKGKSPS